MARRSRLGAHRHRLCYRFFQRVCLPAFVGELANDFGLLPQGVGILASAYFFGYLLMQFPAGVLVDALGVRIVVIGSLAASSVGTLFFVLSPSLPFAFLSRMLIACGDALVFTALIKFVASQFRDSRFGILSGLSQLGGYLGGILATTPLVMAIAIFGWRSTFLGVSVVAAINLALCICLLPTYARTGTKLAAILEALEVARSHLKERASWGCVLTFASHFVTVTTISAVWGIPMLVDAYGMERTSASFPLLIFMAGCMAGSILFGLVADRLQSLAKALIVISAGRLAALVFLAPAIGVEIGPLGVTMCFLLLGVIGGGMTPVILKGVKAIYSTTSIGIGAAINTTLSGLLMAALQPVFGAVLEMSWDGQGAHHYTREGYNNLIVLLAVTSALGFVGPLLMRRRTG